MPNTNTSPNESGKSELSDGDVSVRLAAAQGLASIGWKPATDDDRVKVFAAKMDFESCSKVGVNAARPLVELLRADYGYVREWVSRTLVEIGPGSIPALVAQIGTEYDVDAKMIAHTLVELGQPSYEPLLKVLKDGSVREKMWAARALRNLGNADAVPTLRTALGGIPEPQKARTGTGGFLIRPMTSSTWDRDERTAEGDARVAIQFAISVLEKKAK